MSAFFASLQVQVARWEEDTTAEEYQELLYQTQSDINCWVQSGIVVKVMVNHETPNPVGPGGGTLIFDGVPIAAYETTDQMDRVLDEWDAT